MTSTQKLITAPIVASSERTSKRGNKFFIITLLGVAQPITVFADDAAAIKANWASFSKDADGRPMVPLIVTISRTADRQIEGVTVPGYTNYTAKLSNVAAEACPF